jgi:hypothetical protein
MSTQSNISTDPQSTVEESEAEVDNAVNQEPPWDNSWDDYGWDPEVQCPICCMWSAGWDGGGALALQESNWCSECSDMWELTGLYR